MPTIPRTIINAILSHAQQQPGNEVCGLVAARDGIATRIFRVANAAQTPDVLFQMDPKQQIDAMRQMREAGESLFAIYHSHPHGPIQPSPRDLAEAAYPDILYLIVSMDTKGVLQLGGFHLEDGAFRPVELTSE